MTPEERKAKAKQRATEREALYAKLPYASLGACTKAILVLPPGDDVRLELQMCVVTENLRERYDGTKWAVRDIILEVEDLGRFIVALVARYNSLVRQANEISSEVKMEQLASIKER